MKIRIEINTDGAAFGYTPGAEVARILRDVVADRYRVYCIAPGENFPLIDANGNTCGRVTVEGDE